MKIYWKLDNTYHIQEPLAKDLYFGVFKSHKFIGMPDCDFCWLCNHSFEIHIQYGVENDPATKRF